MRAHLCILLRQSRAHHATRHPMQAAKQRREDVGVELYGFQQSLAKLQLQHQE